MPTAPGNLFHFPSRQLSGKKNTHGCTLIMKIKKDNTFKIKGKNESGKSQEVSIYCVVTKKDESKIGSSAKQILVCSK